MTTQRENSSFYLNFTLNFAFLAKTLACRHTFKAYALNTHPQTPSARAGALMHEVREFFKIYKIPFQKRQNKGENSQKTPKIQRKFKKNAQN